MAAKNPNAQQGPTQRPESHDPSHAADAPPCRLSLIKGEHRWLFRWQPGSEAQLIEAIAELARDSAVPFDWFDAAILCKHIAQPLRDSN
jgi:hypothetical protein